MFQFNEEELVNKTILVGYTYIDVNDNINKQNQYLATIREVREDALVAEAEDGSRSLIPYDPGTVALAPRGEYLLTASGQRVKNPDFLTSWNIFLTEDLQDSTGCAPNYAPFHNHVPTEWEHEDDYDPEYLKYLIERYGERYLGKTVLIGITYYRQTEQEPTFEKQEQFFGRIARVQFPTGILIQFGNGDTYNLPPDLSWLEPAAPGEYTLRTTGETVVNPDFISIWTVNQPGEKSP